jgi:hypothetical protein
LPWLLSIPFGAKRINSQQPTRDEILFVIADNGNFRALNFYLNKAGPVALG